MYEGRNERTNERTPRPNTLPLFYYVVGLKKKKKKKKDRNRKIIRNCKFYFFEGVGRCYDQSWCWVAFFTLCTAVSLWVQLVLVGLSTYPWNLLWMLTLLRHWPCINMVLLKLTMYYTSLQMLWFFGDVSDTSSI